MRSNNAPPPSALPQPMFSGGAGDQEQHDTTEQYGRSLHIARKKHLWMQKTKTHIENFTLQCEFFKSLGSSACPIRLSSYVFAHCMQETLMNAKKKKKHTSKSALYSMYFSSHMEVHLVQLDYQVMCLAERYYE